MSNLSKSILLENKCIISVFLTYKKGKKEKVVILHQTVFALVILSVNSLFCCFIEKRIGLLYDNKVLVLCVGNLFYKNISVAYRTV